jgi:cation diffusion facilitator family transporter
MVGASTTRDEHDRLRAVRRVLFLALAINVGAAAAKLSYGYYTGTLGLVADGYHSLLDVAATCLALVGATLAAAPPDDEHQYGHRKFEVLSAMGVSLFIFAGAAEVLHEAWERARLGLEAVQPDVTWKSFAITGGSLVLSFLLSRYETRRARELGSALLDSDASHTWGDVAGSIAVLVSLVVTKFLHPAADIVIAFLLGAYLVRVGYKVLMRGMGVVADRAVLDPLKVAAVAREFEGVHGTARIRTRGQEDHAFLDMVILVSPTLTVAEAHALVDRIEERLAGAFPGLRDIVIHVEPAAQDAASDPPGVASAAGTERMLAH